MNLISFSLFGDGAIYNRGAVANAKLARELYPGWSVRFYVDAWVTVADELESLGCELVWMPQCEGAKAMCWRFLPLADSSLDYVIVRDADSRLNVREVAAVKAWMESGRRTHIMRDHEHHRSYPVFAGMFGCKGGSLPNIEDWIRSWRRWHARMDDMLLLNQFAWPSLQDDVMHHTSVENQWGGVPFPEHEPYAGFVGERIE